MIQKCAEHIAANFPFLAQTKIIVACSGGLDSIVLAHLLHQLGFEIALAHCNFQLRNEESEADQHFVTSFANQLKVPFFIKKFDTNQYAKKNKTSIQLAARELRYTWFYELLEEISFDFIATAHHADDALETFFINLSRGTGISGLLGIPAINNKIIRPLLAFSRNEIELFAIENSLQWREDSSNASDKYLRNKIRHHISPLLKEIEPNFLESFQKTQTFLNQTNTLAKDAISFYYEKVTRKEKDIIYFDIPAVLKLENYQAYLYNWLQKYHFTAWSDVYNLLNAATGKQVFAPKHKLLKNRSQLILSKISESKQEVFLIEKKCKNVNFPIKLKLCKVDDILQTSTSTIFVNEDSLRFPLEVRKWKTADSFQPLGMNGKSKKVSKLLKDTKVSLLGKESVYVLLSENKIIWVIGYQADERFKVQDTTKHILQISLGF